MPEQISNLTKAEILSEALPYIRKFSNSTIVIKYGGNAMIDETLKQSFAKDIALLKLVGFNPVVVHGGGPQINALLERVGKKGEFFQGLRITDNETMSIVEMVLGGSVNKEIVSLINLFGGKAIGITGIDGHFIKAKKIKLNIDQNSPQVDIGQVGEVTEINADFLSNLISSNSIPVIAPIGVGMNGEAFNINADIVAGKIASALHATKLIMMTNTPGVLDKNGNLLTDLTPNKISTLIEDGTLYGGMLPKINSALEAAKEGNNAVHIIDGRVPHALLLELFTDEGIGSMILPREKENTI
ncbi:acetylglutamate kinase [Neisseriaceae bacterium PsAf]|nr:acetylglutamate kinase [Neisseriaceae bacterium PsAf]MCV2502663.1 acetylglutamate kinase [Neisseriaceae bacterium]